jgi:hypothetical protein
MLGYEGHIAWAEASCDGGRVVLLPIVDRSPRGLKTNVLSFSNVAAKLEFHDKRSRKGFGHADPYPPPCKM